MKSLLVLIFAGFLLSACAGAATGSRTQPATSPAAAPASASTPAPAASGQCPSGSLEGCFSYSQMDSFLETVEPLVARFFQATYPNVPAPRNVVFIPGGRLARSACGGYSDSTAYEYCPASASIYIGQDLLWSFYRRQGDAAPVIGLAHEWGHHLQYMLDVPFPRGNAQSVRFENQADCLAGAFARYADEEGWLEADDMDDIGALLQAVGSREGSGRDHGTAAERRQAFDLGFRDGARGCNSYFPEAPVA